MPDAIITSTASTFGTISGTFAADQSTVTGTVTGIVAGTLSGSVGVPGPAGPAGVGVPAGGSAGQFLTKIDGTNYNTDWTTLNLSAYLTKAGNLSGLTDLATARDNLQLGVLYSPTFAGLTVQGAGSNVANLTPTSLTLNQPGYGYFTIQPSQGIVFPDATVQTTAFTGIPAGYITSVSSPLSVTSGNLSVDLSAYLTTATAASTYQTLSGMSSYLLSSTAASTYQTLSGMSDYLSKAGNLAGLASTSTARTNLGLGSLAIVNDAPSDGSQYARRNAAWEVVSSTSPYITSVSSPLSVTAGNLTVDLSAYAPLASPLFTGDARAVTPAFGDNDTSIATTAFVQSALAGGTAVARNLEVEVRNQSGSTIPAGSIVYISGATGNKPLITLAQANNDANSAQTIGFTKTAITNNGTGFVIVRGELENIDTSALTEGVQLYLSPTTAGTWTTTKPSAPQHLVYVGIVIRSHPTLGTILVAVQNGYELEELHDVAIGTLANNDLLAYESSTDLWKNKTYSALGLLTSADAASTYQTLSGMSSYLTTSAAASTYLTQANAASTYYLQTNPAGYITSSALSPYLTSATAASTYQTLSGMSSYLTTATAASTYAPIASPTFTGLATFDNPGNYAISVPASGVGYDIRIEGQLFTMRNAGAEVIRISPGGIKYPDGVTQSVAYPGPSGFLLKADNLSGLANTGTARTNLGLGTMATETASNYLTTATAASTYYLQTNPAGYITSSALSPYLTSATAASTYFTIASAASKADLASPTFTGVPAAPTASPGTNTTQIATTAFVTAAVSASTGATWGSITGTLSSQTDLQSALDAKLSTATAASTYQTLSGMSSYLTTSSAASTYQTISGMSSYLTTATAASTYAPLASPALTGNPTAPTPATADNDTSIATTAFVKAQGYLTSAPVTSVAGRTGAVTLSTADISGLGTMATATAADYSTTTVANGLYYPLSSNPAGYLTTAPVTSVAGRTGAVTLAVADVSGAAPLASPALTGTPTAPTASAGTSTTQLATTAFVTTADNLKANLASPAFTGTPTAPTATAGTNTTQIATTAFVQAAIPTNNVKAWVNFLGVGTVAINASNNVSSITDNAVGDYTVNFTTAISDANYTVLTSDYGRTGFATGLRTAASAWTGAPTTKTTTAARIAVGYYDGNLYDVYQVDVAILR